MTNVTASYKGHAITRTNITTDTRHGVANVYAIDGAHSKNACARPFLTSIAACREYINEQFAVADRLADYAAYTD